MTTDIAGLRAAAEATLRQRQECDIVDCGPHDLSLDPEEVLALLRLLDAAQAEVERLNACMDAIAADALVDAERLGNLRAAVEGLHGHFDPMCAIEDAPSDRTVVSRFAVLRLLRGA